MVACGGGLRVRFEDGKWREAPHQGLREGKLTGEFSGVWSSRGHIQDISVKM